jgi:hypothetical protein
MVVVDENVPQYFLGSDQEYPRTNCKQLIQLALVKLLIFMGEP